MTTKSKPKFLRKDSHKYSKLGKSRKNKQKWRNPNGRDNKMREHKKGHRKVVSVGHSSDKISRGMIKGKNPVLILNVKDLDKIKESGIGVVGNVGKKKKMEIAKAAKEKKIELANMNAGKYLKVNEVGAEGKKKKVEAKKDEKKTETKKENKVEEKE